MRTAPRQMYYDRQGNPMTMERWAAAFEDDKIQRLLHEYVDPVGDVRVSTVWLGLDHRFVDEGEPLIFETMVFGGPHDQSQWRWPTEEAARAGHAEILKALREGRDPKELP